MDKILHQLHVLGANGVARTETVDGREHLVVPVIALMEGVIHAVNSKVPEFVPSATLSKGHESWNGHPLVVGHPVRDGKQVSAHDPTVLAKHGFGSIRKTYMNGNRLGMEALVDPQRLEALGQDQLLADLRAGNQIEVSVGAFVTTNDKSGTHLGKEYKAEWLEMMPDHLAFLPGGRGACSLAMGCGAHRAAMHLVTAEGYELVDLGGPGSGPHKVGDRVSVLVTDHSDAYGSTSKKKKGTVTELHPNGQVTVVHDDGAGFSKHHESAVKKLRGASGGDIVAFTTLAGQSFSDRISAVNTAVDQKWNQQGGLASAPVGYAYATQVFDNSCIIQKADKFYAVPYDTKDGVVTLGEPTEVRQEYVAAAAGMQDCAMCDGSGSVDGNPCEGCDGKGEIRAAAGARHSEGDRQMIQTSHDHMVKLGAECDRANFRFNSNPEGINQYTKHASGAETRKRSDTNTLVRHPEAPGHEVSINRYHSIEPGPRGDVHKDTYALRHFGPGQKYKDSTVVATHDKLTDAINAASDHLKAQGKLKPLEEGGTDSPELRAACSCQDHNTGDSNMTKEQKAAAIKALVANPNSGFAPGDEPILEAANDDRIVAFATAAEARAKETADLKAASEKAAADVVKATTDAATAQATADKAAADLKAASERKPTAEEWLAVAPAEIKTLVERTQATDAARKLHLVGELKAAQAEMNEAELTAEPLANLERLAKMLKVGEAKPDFSGKLAPRAAAESFAPPNPYAAGIAVLQAANK